MSLPQRVTRTGGQQMTTTTADEVSLTTTSSFTAPIVKLGTKVSAAVRARWDAAGAKVRSLLNLPTKDEIAQLAARLDEIEKRLGAVRKSTTAEKRVRRKRAPRPTL
jgi:hypothetical protein